MSPSLRPEAGVFQVADLCRGVLFVILITPGDERRTEDGEDRETRE